MGRFRSSENPRQRLQNPRVTGTGFVQLTAGQDHLTLLFGQSAAEVKQFPFLSLEKGGVPGDPLGLVQIGFFGRGKHVFTVSIKSIRIGPRLTESTYPRQRPSCLDGG